MSEYSPVYYPGKIVELEKENTDIHAKLEAAEKEISLLKARKDDMYLAFNDKDVYSELGRIARKCIATDMWYCKGVFNSPECLKIKNERSCQYTEFCEYAKKLKGGSSDVQA
ncbi:hypothetical protein M7775_13580 [Sporomusa sphaeroides DSM 2875]|uniref:hypothetical protein n=1 Tax=Sporomusa sphaeroides TaxID=47679 RepID=UPI00202F0F26|nr:hypothetical protein [Sporomusa sphaeroides]MCM0759584.1 hypothetical protein [Sporomusa sphaeroides DSM 2875]